MTWVYLVLISALFFAFRQIFTKQCLEKEHTLVTLFWVSLLIGLFTLPFYGSMNFFPGFGLLFLILIKASILATASYYLFHALRHMEISMVAPITNLSPIFLMIFSYFLLGERLSLLQYAGIIVILVGAYMLEIHSIKHFFEPFKLMRDNNIGGLILALALLSVCGIFEKIILRTLDIYTDLFYTMIVVSAIYLGIILRKHYTRDLWHVIKVNYHYVLIIGFLGYVSDLLIYVVIAMPLVPISLIIPIKRTSTVIATFFGGSMLHEQRVLHKVGCCSLMVFGVFALFV